MGKNKSSNPTERKIIWECFQKEKNILKVTQTLGFSRGKVRNALAYFKKNNTFENLPRKRPRKTTPADDRQLVRLCKKDPFLTSTQIRAQMEEAYNVVLSAQTIRRRLKEKNLNGRIARRKPNLSKKNISRRLKFAKNYFQKSSRFWNLVVWSDESKFNVFGNDGRPYVRRPPLKELDPRYTKKTVKHGGSSVMVWGCFTASGVGPIVQINGKMTGEMYRDILETHLNREYADNLPLAWIFQQDNDPKHCSRVVKSWFETNSISVLEWPAQSPDLNPIENLWGIIKRAVAARKPMNRSSLWEIIQQEWNKITPSQCEALVGTMTNRCAEVIRQKGYPTKY